MTRASSPCPGEAPESMPLLAPPDPVDGGALPLAALESWGLAVTRRCADDGAGKEFFLSMVWTVLSKRRKIDSARVRMGSNSIELESSLTVSLVSTSRRKDRAGGHTVFQNLIKML